VAEEIDQVFCLAAFGAKMDVRQADSAIAKFHGLPHNWTMGDRMAGMYYRI
jgi:hypothetical protein